MAMPFNCDSCSQGISPLHPRVHCITCFDYDLCANCALGDRFTLNHLPSHTIQLFKISGTPPLQQGQVPVRSQTTIVYPPEVVHHGQASTQPRPAGGQQQMGPPSDAPPPHYDESRWTPFFDANMGPTPAFLAVLNALFGRLDSSSAGYITPEVYSAFLDDEGCRDESNIWKSYLTESRDSVPVDAADAAMKKLLEAFGIEHVLAARAHSDSPTTPLLTRQGFIDNTCLEVLYAPSEHWEYLGRVLKKYELQQFAGWGDLPRNVLPANTDPATLQRVQVAMRVMQMDNQREALVAEANAQAELNLAQAMLESQILMANALEQGSASQYSALF